jgi:trehalose synthase
MIEEHPDLDAHLVLAGPNVNSVADDPEAPAVFHDVLCAWRNLPHTLRKRVHLAMLPTTDTQENAAIVNALQRHSSVVVQKSLHEGFGLTVTEAMWKGRAIVASAVGGIQDQITHEVHGLLLPDPTDLGAFADAVHRLLTDPALAAKLGDGARERARTEFNGLRHLLEYSRLINALLD